ncbi:MAG: alpha/beta hydrolase [Oscillospiraceae bacterium]|nr:alpha/beta hydrolase [Oscillospiraceae bacterium]
MSIYRSLEGKEKILSLYDAQLKRLKEPHSDIMIDTSFGKTHLIKTGDPDGIPLLVFHGGNATTAYTLLSCDFLMKDFLIYAADTIGHPGKSEEVSLSPGNYDYGKWAGEIITGLGFESMACFSGSFGAGIIAKLMCVCPGKVKRAVLYIPSGINNAPAVSNIRMLMPMIAYRITHEDKWLKRCIMPLAITEDNITDDLYETAKLSITYSRVKTGMPGNVSEKLIGQCTAPTLVMAAEKDCMFPAGRVIPRAEKIIKNCTTYLLKDRGHMNFLTDGEKQMIVDFLKG